TNFAAASAGRHLVFSSQSTLQASSLADKNITYFPSQTMKKWQRIDQNSGFSSRLPSKQRSRGGLCG
ncbi:MAG: hypothetical protein ABSH08_10125, partial [Tepidisphaeraceae bacterium]